MNLNPEDNPTTKQIDRAYKKAALKAHPDKGGDSFMFKAVTDAYEIICSVMQDEEEAKKYDIKKVRSERAVRTHGGVTTRQIRIAHFEKRRVA